MSVVRLRDSFRLERPPPTVEGFGGDWACLFAPENCTVPKAPPRMGRGGGGGGGGISSVKFGSTIVGCWSGCATTPL